MNERYDEAVLAEHIELANAAIYEHHGKDSIKIVNYLGYTSNSYFNKSLDVVVFHRNNGGSTGEFYKQTVKLTTQMQHSQDKLQKVEEILGVGISSEFDSNDAMLSFYA